MKKQNFANTSAQMFTPKTASTFTMIDLRKYVRFMAAMVLNHTNIATSLLDRLHQPFQSVKPWISNVM